MYLYLLSMNEHTIFYFQQHQSYKFNADSLLSWACVKKNECKSQRPYFVMKNNQTTKTNELYKKKKKKLHKNQSLQNPTHSALCS